MKRNELENWKIVWRRGVQYQNDIRLTSTGGDEHLRYLPDRYMLIALTTELRPSFSSFASHHPGFSTETLHGLVYT